jgi:hypothetical protein
MSAIITNHAMKAIRKRIGINKKAVQSLADKALLNGLWHKHLKGSLKKYVSKQYNKYETANGIRIYGEYIFFFKGSYLLTVYSIPVKYKNNLKAIKEKNYEQI